MSINSTIIVSADGQLWLSTGRPGAMTKVPAGVSLNEALDGFIRLNGCPKCKFSCEGEDGDGWNVFKGIFSVKRQGLSAQSSQVTLDQLSRQPVFSVRTHIDGRSGTVEFYPGGSLRIRPDLRPSHCYNPTVNIARLVQLIEKGGRYGLPLSDTSITLIGEGEDKRVYFDFKGKYPSVYLSASEVLAGISA